jgi:hypothetical protein
MLAREKSQREEGSQKSGGERENKRHMWPKKAEERREVLKDRVRKSGRREVWARSRHGEMSKSILLIRSKDVGS